MPNYKRVFIQNSYVFLTVVAHNRMPLLVKNIEILRDSFRQTKIRYRFKIVASVILPDHLHLVLNPENIDEYPKIISEIKYNFSKNFTRNKNLTPSKINKREKGIWQRRCYEHTILDERDLQHHVDYIHYNPVKHELVDNVKDWSYSSFNKFVKNGFYDSNWGGLCGY